MAGWEDLEQALPLDVRDVSQAREDLDRLALRVLGDEDGKSQFAPGKPSDEPKSPVATKIFTPCDTALAKIESYF